MRIATRLLITLAAAAIILPATHYLVYAYDIAVGSPLYCLILGFSFPLVLLVWDVTGRLQRQMKISD